MFDGGTNDGWPTPIIQTFNGDDSTLTLDMDQQGWVVDMMFIGMRQSAQ